MATNYKPKNYTTPIGNLHYGFLRPNHQKNLERDVTKPPKMGYSVTLVLDKDSLAHKELEQAVKEEWKRFKDLNPNVKGMPTTFPIKEIFEKHPTEKDEDGEPVKIPTGKVGIQAKTTSIVKGSGGRPDFEKTISIFDHKGTDVTNIYNNAKWAIGNDTTGRIIGSLYAGTHPSGSSYVSLFLNAVQIAKLDKYEGASIEVDAIDGDDFGDDDFSAPAPLDTSRVEM